jgi:hypothetical protein
MPEIKNPLLMFGGTECVHCHEMDPLVERLEKEERIKIEYLESWHNDENAALLEKLDGGRCGGVPFFYNQTSKKIICGSCDYETLKNWAKSV